MGMAEFPSDRDGFFCSGKPWGTGQLQNLEDENVTYHLGIPRHMEKSDQVILDKVALIGFSFLSNSVLIPLMVLPRHHPWKNDMDGLSDQI